MDDPLSFVPAQPRCPQARILIVDDEPAMANAIERILHNAGYETAVANDGSTAEALFQTFKPMLVTLDLRMPQRDGMQVLSALARLQEARQAPPCKVLIVSADQQADSELAWAVGAHGSVSKPFENQVLLSEVSRLLMS